MTPHIDIQANELRLATLRAGQVSFLIHSQPSPLAITTSNVGRKLDEHDDTQINLRPILICTPRSMFLIFHDSRSGY